MKKTEKIEIRIDHVEKERLLEIAKHRGMSLTELSRQALQDVWDGENGVPLSPFKRPPVHMLPPRKRRFVLFALISFNTGLLLAILILLGWYIGRLG